MTFVASPAPDASAADSSPRSPRAFEPWTGWLAAFILVAGLLAFLPEGMADILCWLILGVVATMAVGAIVLGLEHLLDCDAG